MGIVPGMIKGLGVTAKTAYDTIFPDGPLKPPSPSKGAVTVQYPHEKETPTARRGLPVRRPVLESRVRVFRAANR